MIEIAEYVRYLLLAFFCALGLLLCLALLAEFASLLGFTTPTPEPRRAAPPVQPGRHRADDELTQRLPADITEEWTHGMA